MRFLLVLLMILALPVQAALQIDITGAMSEPMPIAIPQIISQTPVQKEAAEEIRQVIVDDLERTGLFRVIKERAYVQEFTSLDDKVRFADWQVIGAQVLLQAQMAGGQIIENNQVKSDKPLQVSFTLWDVFAQKQMTAKILTNKNKQSLRTLGHIIADVIYERLTGEKGYFNSLIVFIAEKGSQKNRQKRLAIMDSDGANVRYLTDGSYRVLTPRFNPNMGQITYFSYQGGDPQVYMMDVDSKKGRMLGTFKGMTFAPRFSPDGKSLLITQAHHGNSDIYLYDLKTGFKKQLTDHPAIDTSPSFSPDGKKIVFNSDRGGSQQLYVMDANGNNVQRISFGDGGYATPVWSPRGDYIAFTKIERGGDENHKFHIGVMRADGSGERLIANGFLVEGPTWAPNGRILMFFRRLPFDGWGNKGKAKLYTIDITGHNEQLVDTPTDASDPAWSPLLTEIQAE